MSAIFGWFISTRVGRWLAAGGAAALAVGLLLLRAFAAGKKVERQAADKASLTNLQARNETDESISIMSPDTRRNQLSGWVRDDK